MYKMVQPVLRKITIYLFIVLISADCTSAMFYKVKLSDMTFTFYVSKYPEKKYTIMRFSSKWFHFSVKILIQFIVIWEKSVAA